MIWYRNSFWASAVSMFGCACVFVSISMFGEDPGAATITIIVGIALALWGKSISNKKAFKVWWQKVVEANLVPEIVKSTQVAIEIYNKNPQALTLNKIAELNPAAAAQIRASIEAKKKK